ncbi:MAG: hypothetical protein HGB12_10450 [Bacteroidetes bacterium]|nr:hypothetical protein [Bacteroidota bacterium]
MTPKKNPAFTKSLALCCIANRVKKMRMFSLTMLSVCFLISGCDKKENDDDQYGTNCKIIKNTINNSYEASVDYDLNNRIIEMNYTGSGNPAAKMTVVYNNNLAILDYYIGGALTMTTEATLNSAGNIIETNTTDSAGNDVINEFFTYNSDNKIIELRGTDFSSNITDTLTIEWNAGNATKILRTQGTILCDYYTGQTSSLKYGYGNVVLLIDRLDMDIATFYSNDFIKTYDINGVNPIHFSYEFNSDGKANKITTSSGGNSSTTVVKYECE